MCLRQVEHIHDHLWLRYSITVNQESSAVFGKTGTLSTCSYVDANTPYLHRRRLVPNFRSIRHHALYILHNRARHKMVWHQFETITPGTKTEEKCTFSYIFTIIRKFTEIQNFPFISSNIPAASAYGIYISQLIIYCRACGCYHDFPDSGLLLTRKLLNQEYPVVKLKSSLRKF